MCVKKHYDNEEEAKNTFSQEKEATQAKLLLVQGNLAKQEGPDTYLIEECMGQALFDGNLKRKTFAKGKFYVVN